MTTIGPTSVTTVKASEEKMAISKIVLYAMIGAIAFVLVVIIILVIFLCKRRKKDPTKIKDPSMQMKILDDENNEAEATILCGRAKKKSKKSDAPLPETLPVVPHYEPGTMMEGVYERISSADMDTKYDVSFLGKPKDKVEIDVNTYVSIGRSNSFNPKSREKPVVKRSRDEHNDKVKRNESIKCIETGIAPSETDDIKVRLQELTKTEPNTRIKQKRTSTKKQKANSSPANLKTHELVKITPPAMKKDLNKTKINADIHGCGKPPSVSGASVVSSNDSEAASNLGTDSGYEDINSESSPTAKRIHLNIDGTLTNSNSGSPISAARRNYIDVDVMPSSMLLQQRSNSIIERRNSQKPPEDDSSKESSLLIESTDCIYTQVTIDPQPT